MDPWYKIALPRREVREGRSFNPDEFAIALEQVMAGMAPDDYRDPEKFFSRTYFTRALIDHTGTVLRRLAGETANAPPVLSFITQFGGGKTHTLTALYHLATNGPKAAGFAGIPEVLARAGLNAVPVAKVGIFVGNAWDPAEGRETPWIDLARQIAGEDGVRALGRAAHTTPPGTEALGRVFSAAGGPVLLLFDEVLNFVNRHRDLADPFFSFIQNLTVAATGRSGVAAVLSLPRSNTEMTQWEHQWQDRITRVVRRVAKDLVANDEAEVSEVVRRRLFEDLGDEKLRRRAAKGYADWCFERRHQLPPEWTVVDAAATDTKAKEALRRRFEACYPFHPATLSVFQRKWQALPQYQQTRGTIAMLALWLSRSYARDHQLARRDPMVMLGSAPLDDRDFRAVVLGQLGDHRLGAAIETDVAGPNSHANALDADTKGALRRLHRRVGAAILFESSGGQTDKVAHLPELRFALGGPDVDTTSIDNAAKALEQRGFFVRGIGSDGFRLGPKAKLNKVMADRRASLDEDEDVRPAERRLVKEQFERGAGLPVIAFPEDGTAIQDTPRLALVVGEPSLEWDGSEALRRQIAEWTTRRGEASRLYPASMIWCLRKPGRELRQRVETWLAWDRVAREVSQGLLGEDYDEEERRDVRTRVKEAEDAAKEAVWATYRFVVLADSREQGGLKTIDLGAGHSSAAESLSGRVLGALRSQALLNETIGAGYIDRYWPEAFAKSGAWPLSGLRQSFLNGALTRLLDPDKTLRTKIIEFVERGDFGLASGAQKDGTYERVWYEEELPSEEVAFEGDVYLLKKPVAERLKEGRREEEPSEPPSRPAQSVTGDETPGEAPEAPSPEPTIDDGLETLRITGTVPPEQWSKLGYKLIPKLRSAEGLDLRVDLSATATALAAAAIEDDIRQTLGDLGLGHLLTVERGKQE